MTETLFSKKMQFFITKIAFIWTMVGKPTMVKINAISAMKKSILLEKKLIHILRYHITNIMILLKNFLL